MTVTFHLVYKICNLVNNKLCYYVHCTHIVNLKLDRLLKRVAGMEALSVEANLIHTLNWLVDLVWLRPQMEALRPKPCFDHGLPMEATIINGLLMGATWQVATIHPNCTRAL